MNNSDKEYFNASTRIWPYLCTTKNQGLLYYNSSPRLIEYLDSD